MSQDSISQPLRVALIGCGWIAEIAHVPLLKASRSAVLEAAVEPDRVRAAWLEAQVPGIRLLDLDQALASKEIDAVVVAVPTALHAEIAVEAFNAGKHVYLEKPIAADLRAGRAVVDAWLESGRTGMVGYNFRRSPVAESGAGVIAAGDVGEIMELQSEFLWAAERIEGWRADPKAGGGVLLDLASHHFDLIPNLVGRQIEAVQCTVRSVRSPEDSAAIDLHLEGGTRAQILASFVTGVQANRVQVLGSEGSLLVDLLDPVPNPVIRRPGKGERLLRATRAAGRLHPKRLLSPPGAEPSFGRNLEAFLAAARARVQARPDMSDGLAALAAVEAARVSARMDGRRVEVEGPAGPDPRVG